jgi:hypothetical protein
MLHRVSFVLTVALAVCLAAGQVAAEVFAYPKKGQSQEQFEKDQFECHKWAKGQTGVDPTQPQPSASAPPPQRGGAVRGAANEARAAEPAGRRGSTAGPSPGAGVPHAV